VVSKWFSLEAVLKWFCHATAEIPGDVASRPESLSSGATGALISSISNSPTSHYKEF